MELFKITKEGNGLIATNKSTKDLMYILGNKSKNHFLFGFRNNGGQTNASKSGWTPRKKPYHYEKIGHRWKRKSDVGRNILIQSGTLRRSISVKYASNRRVDVGTRGVIYAQIHNEGLMGRAFGKYPFKMPKREFIGRSTPLEKQMRSIIEKELIPKIKK